MNRRTYLGGFGAAVATGTLAGCTGNGTDGNGNGSGNGNSDADEEEEDDGTTAYGVLSTSITDQPNDIADFESLLITIEGIWVKPDGADDGDEDEEEADDGDAPEDDGEDAGDETDRDESEEEDDENGSDENGTDDGEDVDESQGRYYIEFEEPQEADLVELQGDNTQLIDETELEVGEYQFLQLNVSDATGTLEADDEEAVVETPGNAPLQFKHAFEIRADERTRFFADFAPFRRGNGEYLIRPVASGTQVLYGDEEYDGGSDDGEATDGGEDETNDDGEPADDDTDTGDDPSGNGPPDDAGPDGSSRVLTS